MHKKYLSVLAAFAMVAGLLTFAVPAQASHSAPDDLSIFMPNDSYTEKDQLSDQFDGEDNLAHLTAVASVDTDNVTFYVCPAGQAPFQEDGNNVEENPGCDVIGTDNTGQQPGELDVHGDPTADEAYEVFWNIPQELDGDSVDIFALACQGSGPGTADTDPADEVPDNCIQDEESNIFLEDSSDEDDLISGEIQGICTAPGSGEDFGDPDNPADDDNECFEDADGDSLDLDDRPFKEDLAIHGGIVPNDGFTLRFTTSADVATAAACLAEPANSESEPPRCDATREATLEQEFTTYKQWVVYFDDGDVPDDEEIDLAIFGTPEDTSGVSGAECGDGGFTSFASPGFLGGDQCVFDEHYVVSTERESNNFVLTFDDDDDFTYEDDCDDPTTEVDNQLEDDHAIYACFTDQFGDPFPADAGTADVTFESEGPEGSEISFCDGTSHDHDDDGRDEHCHEDEGDSFEDDGDEVFYAEVDNYSDGDQTATPGDQTIIACIDDEATSGTEDDPGTDHGCADDDDATTNSIVKHWLTAPDETRLVFSDGTPEPGECLTGDTSRENEVGDLDDLLVCTFDSDGNFTGTEPAGSGRLQWTITPAGGGELTATRFTESPPSETGSDGTAIATIESFRQGNDIITVCLQNDPGGNAVTGQANDCSSVQKRVTQTAGPAQCNDNQDNDGDGLIDFPADPGCTSANDDSETDQGDPTRRKHDRSVRIKGFDHVNFPNRRQLEVRIKVRHADDHGFGGCQKGVPVVLQIRADGRWIDRKSGTTNRKGVSKILIQDIPAKYRAKATRLVVENEDRNRIEVCRRAKSAGKRHRH